MMGATLSPATRVKRQLPTKTQQIEEAVEQGCLVLRDIADKTNLSYRTVNAIVASLESRGRLATDDTNLRRGERRFYDPRKPRENPSLRLQQVWAAVVAGSPLLAEASDFATWVLKPLMLLVTAVI